MEPFVAFKYLHIVSMFFAIALAVSTELVLRRVADSGDRHAIATTVGRIRPLGNVSTVLFLVGIAFGIAAALTGQINLLAPWLILSYLAVAGAFAIGLLLTDPWVTRLEAAATATGDGSAGDLSAVIAEAPARIGTWVLMGLIAILVFLMVVKPFA
jgi:multisubunit Na+/H+ antiporter MnhG subunit